MGMLSPGNLCCDLVFIIPTTTLFHFGVLESSVHMEWMRAVCRRLKMRYRYSKDIVYNNFPWPSCTPEYSNTSGAAGIEEGISFNASVRTGDDINRGDNVSHIASARIGKCEPDGNKTGGADLKMIERIERTAQTILDARDLYPDASLADLYDPKTMPPELRKAHKNNDSAVLTAYGFPTSATKPEIATLLFTLHEKHRNA